MHRERDFSRAVALALSAHVLGLLVLGLVQRGRDESVPAPSRELDVGVWSLEPTEMASADDRGRGTSARSTAEVTPAKQTRPVRGIDPSRPTNSATADAVAASDPTAASDPVVTTTEENTSNESPSGNVASGETTKDPKNASNRPLLTREQLGLGEGSYAVLLPEESPVKKDMQSRLAQNQRLETSIRQDAVERAGELGLGSEGPILAKLETLALQSMSDVTGIATISARLLANGKLDLQLLGTSSDRAAWGRILAQAQQELAAQKLKVPTGSRGLDLTIRVSSRVQLPSGADPGFSTKVLGIPLKKGEGKNSPGLEVLSSLPKVNCDEDEKNVSLRCRLGWDALRLNFDLADLSGKRGRVVSARVVRRTVL